jgi:hypothetical protein
MSFSRPIHGLILSGRTVPLNVILLALHNFLGFLKHPEINLMDPTVYKLELREGHYIGRGPSSTDLQYPLYRLPATCSVEYYIF